MMKKNKSESVSSDKNISILQSDFDILMCHYDFVRTLLLVGSAFGPGSNLVVQFKSMDDGLLLLQAARSDVCVDYEAEDVGSTVALKPEPLKNVCTSLNYVG